ncbi:MAG: phosphoribosylformylglycinamidine synthase I [Thaumarchaeota archaeon]|nr:phosphoribosylformylglycinamidine synthase I [Nitrososphaerota archaeon]
MERERIKICVMRVGGTNRDADAAVCLEDQGAIVEVLHLNDVLRRRNLNSYDGLVFPGGFAYGDYVRAGAIWAKRIRASLREDLNTFVQSGKPVLGICNGFQVLIETGLLPTPDFSEDSKVALAGNSSGKFECRWINLKAASDSNCVFTKGVSQIMKFPIAHGEGRFIAQDKETYSNLEKNHQVALQYCDDSGLPADKRYPANPNGSEFDIAGICNESGNVLGLMPHPEDAYWGYQTPDWPEKQEIPQFGDGKEIFRAMVDYVQNNF